MRVAYKCKDRLHKPSLQSLQSFLSLFFMTIIPIVHQFTLYTCTYNILSLVLCFYSMFSSLLIYSQYYPDAYYHSQLCRHDVIHVVVVAVDLGRVPGACANDPRDRENRGSATSRAAGLKKTPSDST